MSYPWLTLCVAAIITGMTADHGIELNRLLATPIAEQLAIALREQIISGAIPPEYKLPTEKALADTLHIGPGTARRALGMLQSEGLVVWVKGRGMFAAKAEAIAAAQAAGGKTSPQKKPGSSSS